MGLARTKPFTVSQLYFYHHCRNHQHHHDALGHLQARGANNSSNKSCTRRVTVYDIHILRAESIAYNIWGSVRVKNLIQISFRSHISPLQPGSGPHRAAGNCTQRRCSQRRVAERCGTFERGRKRDATGRGWSFRQYVLCKHYA